MSPSCRVDLRPAQIRRVDDLLAKAKACSPRGVRVTRSDIVFSAIDRGLDILALELARRAAAPGPFDVGVDPPPDDDVPPSSERRPRSSR